MAKTEAIRLWLRPRLDLDVSARLGQNIKLAETSVINSHDRLGTSPGRVRSTFVLRPSSRQRKPSG
ncbi:hypothetical protein FG93_03949 [Bosea sp. LC85]|nr:hypothetical protein FG93_03949 [Bosea sp. LC85]